MRPTRQSEFDAYALNYMEELAHPLRTFVDPAGKYFIEMKYNELKRLMATNGLKSREIGVLEVGCGLGFFEGFLADQVRHLTAIDLSLEMLRVAGRLNPFGTSGGYACSDALALPLADASVDLAFTSCVFHHMRDEDVVPTLQEMRRVCRGGGYVVAFEHNPLNPLTQLVVRSTPLDGTARLLTSRQLAKRFEEAGLHVLRRRFILWGPRIVDQLVQRHLSVLQRLPFGGQYYIWAQKR